MTTDLSQRIAKAIHQLHQQGVRANLIVLGYEEEIQLEGDNPSEGVFRCQIVIDGNSKNRCDAFGQMGKDYVPPNLKRR